MIKPTKPINDLPSSFGGDKENFSASKIQNGYEPDVPDILGGANLNYMLDTLGKKQTYYDAIVNFIRDIPIAKTIGVDVNDNLIYRDWLGGRNYGELVYSAIPLSDSGLKLLDGSVLSYTGVYKNFIDYIDSIYNSYSSLFVTEQVWQQNVTNYGVCGKFVYDSVNKTVRLPKVTGLVEGTVDINALGNIVAAGLPTLSATTVDNHAHGVGSLTVSGYANRVGRTSESATSYSGGFSVLTDKVTSSGFYSQTDSYAKSLSLSAYSGHGFSGNTAGAGSHNHTVNWEGHTNTNTVQPQTIKCFVYMVVANGVTKTDIEIDVDDVISDLNYKADIDLSNATNNISSSAKTFFTRLGLPSTLDNSIIIPTSGNTITAPADGYICCTDDIKLTNNTRSLYGTNMPVISGDSITVTYDSVNANSEIIFVYAQGGI